MRQSFGWVVLAGLFLVACGDDAPGMEDSGLPDAMVMPDAEPMDAMVDATIPDATLMDAMVDASATLCASDAECEMGETCVAGGCLTPCEDGEFEGLASVLEMAGLVPVDYQCQTFSGVGQRTTASGPELFTVAASEAGNVQVSRQAWGAMPTLAIDYSPTGLSDAVTGISLNSFLRLSPSGARAAVGFSTMPFGSNEGQLIIYEPDSVAAVLPMAIPAPGHFAVSWVNESQIAVSGIGLASAGGQSVYVIDTSGAGAGPTAAIVGGCNSGGVAVTSEYVLAGAYCGFGSTWPDGAEDGGRTFVVARSTFDRAVSGGVPVQLFASDGMGLGRGVYEVTTPAGGKFSIFDVLPSGQVVAYTYDAMYGQNAEVFDASFVSRSGLELTATSVSLLSDDHSFSSLMEWEEGLAWYTGRGILRVRR